jgi:hypothetical protein
MKRILKWAAVFVLGALIGGGIAGALVDRFYRGQMIKMYAWNVGSDVLLAHHLRLGLAQIVLECADRRLIDGILELGRNEQFKGLLATEVSLTAAKEYYVCIKKEIPSEVASIMESLPPVPDERCPLPE